MSTRPRTYQAYLLRFWRQDETTPWRVTIYRVDTQQKSHFASLSEAFEFLQGRLETEVPSGIVSEGDPDPGPEV